MQTLNLPGGDLGHRHAGQRDEQHRDVLQGHRLPQAQLAVTVQPPGEHIASFRTGTQRAFFRPSCPCALFPLDSTPPSRVRSSEHRAPQQTLVTTPGTVHGAGRRASGAPACPLEPSPHQYSSTMSPLTFTA
ncbi:hypothetical protein EYF80_048075 [Liparis tanakae]|uniref:Uncharacterized protein n=1 Tax=Liparis tanakae TaxID=230148 RepID=A0A4Z2FKK5_9TELE|nr:hypothetical protein EYF80_048075 [Liparis tanakae]